MFKAQFEVVETRETVRVCSVEEDVGTLKVELFQAVKMPLEEPFAGLKIQASRQRGRKECRLDRGISESLVSWRRTISGTVPIGRHHT
jgi:hypothetical protein